MRKRQPDAKRGTPEERRAGVLPRQPIVNGSAIPDQSATPEFPGSAFRATASQAFQVFRASPGWARPDYLVSPESPGSAFPACLGAAFRVSQAFPVCPAFPD